MTTVKQLKPLAAAMNATRRRAIREEMLWALRAAQTPQIRSRVEFAEQMVWIPEGRYEGEKWQRWMQPYAWHLLDAMDTLPFRRFAITGCVQSGKTLNGVVINTLWHLFEHRHTVIYGVPDIQMARDKWQEELLPVIEASPKLRALLPSRGLGSQGGFSYKLHFKNGAVLRFMGAQGSDAKRSAFTGDVLVMTEVDRYDEAQSTSREASPAQTMCDRVASHGDLAWIYEECTMTTEKGRIHQQFHAGTATELYGKCPHCGQYVLPSREDFKGYEGCASAIEAREQAAFLCPSCRACWTDEERMAMLAGLVRVHRGQLVSAGTDGAAVIEGELPATRIFSMRWNAWHNAFWTSAYLAEKEWEGLYSAHVDDEEKQARQKRWTLPAEPEEEELADVSLAGVMERHQALRKGIVPDDCYRLTAGVDVRQTQVHYVVTSWTAAGVGHVVDYGILPVESKRLGVRQGVLEALESLRDHQFYKVRRTEDGKNEREPAYQKADGTPVPIAFSLLDAGWKSPIGREFLRRTEKLGLKGWLHVYGRGQSEPPKSGRGSYQHPEKLSDRVHWIGEDPCYLTWHEKYRQRAVFANSDWWKTFVHEALAAPADTTASLDLFEAVTEDERREARRYSQQLTSERALSQYVKGRGTVWIWRNETGRQNHWFDCTYYACAAAHLAGVRWALESRPDYRPAAPERRPPAKGRDGQAFLATSR